MVFQLAVIAGDGIGPEVITQGLRAIDKLSSLEKFDYAVTHFDFGGERYLKTGKVLDDSEVAGLKKHDAILLGAVGHPKVKPGILEKGILLKLRFDLDQFINLRPVKLLPGVDSPLRDRTPADINFDVIRENTEDLYCGTGGIARKGTPQEISTQEMISTRFGVERCLRYAFDFCRAKKKAGTGRGQLTLVHKTNVLTFCGDTWFRAFNEIGDADYKDIERQYHHVDACCMYMVAKPQIYDTIVVPNMFGDIITDLGAAIAGGMGVAASGNLNPDRTKPGNLGGPSMFEPVHGSAPDIAGQNKANPLATMVCVAMLLRETGKILGNPKLTAAGDRLDQAVLKITPTFAGKQLDRSGLSTEQVGDLVLAAI